MSDLTTLATLRRIAVKARERLLNQRYQEPDAVMAIEALILEIDEELKYKPPNPVRDLG